MSKTSQERKTLNPIISLFAGTILGIVGTLITSYLTEKNPELVITLTKLGPETTNEQVKKGSKEKNTEDFLAQLEVFFDESDIPFTQYEIQIENKGNEFDDAVIGLIEFPKQLEIINFRVIRYFPSALRGKVIRHTNDIGEIQKKGFFEIEFSELPPKSYCILSFTTSNARIRDNELNVSLVGGKSIGRAQFIQLAHSEASFQIFSQKFVAKTILIATTLLISILVFIRILRSKSEKKE